MIREMKDNPRYKDYKIGRGTYGEPEIAWPQATLEIGNFCSISSEVVIFLGGEHNYHYPTTYPLHLRFGEENSNHPRTKGDVVIGSDVWIGRGVKILSGVQIDSGAVIGAYSIVTRDIGPYWVVAGDPALLVRKRFHQEEITRLLKLRWWDWSDEKIRDSLPLLQSLLTKDTLTNLERRNLE